MIDCMRQFKFEAAHRIYQHKGACSNIHGHSYQVDFSLEPTKEEFEALGNGLDELGMVVDFSAIKSLIGGWIDENWDHATILYDVDPLSDLWVEDEELGTLKSYIMPSNPTAENMAIYLGTEICPKILDLSVIEVTEVIVWETKHCCARWSKDGD